MDLGGRYYLGEKDDYIWLINENLEPKRIYNITHYYDSIFLVRKDTLYVIYSVGNNTAYVDVVDFESRKNT